MAYGLKACSCHPLKDLSIQPQCYSTKYSTFYKTKIQPVWPLCILCDCAVSPTSCSREGPIPGQYPGWPAKKKSGAWGKHGIVADDHRFESAAPCKPIFPSACSFYTFLPCPLEIFQHQSEAFSIIPLFRHFGLLFGHIYKCNMIKGKNQMSLILIWHPMATCIWSWISSA